jgi:hypothetical protein
MAAQLPLFMSEHKGKFSTKLDKGGAPFLVSTPRMKIYLDGKFVDEADAKISVFDHGLLYGDGIFEGIRLYQGNVFRLEAHLERLWYSAKSILLTIPISRKEMAEAVCEACRQNGLRDGYIRLVVTRGVGDLGLSPWLCPKPSVIIIADKIALYPPEYYTTGLANRSIISTTSWPSSRPGRPARSRPSCSTRRGSWPSARATTCSSSTRDACSPPPRSRAR